MFNDNLIYRFYYGWGENIDKTIFLLIVLLFCLGLFFSLASTSLIASDKLETNDYFFFFKHLAFIFLGMSVIIFFSSLSQKNLFRISILLFFVSLFFLALVPIIGTEVKAGKRWLELFFLPRFQPIELLKPFIIIVIATVLSSEKKISIYFKFFISFLTIVPVILLLMMQPDIGQTVLVLLSWLTLVFISGISLYVFFSFFGLSFILLLYLILFIPKFEYIRNRIDSFFNPATGTHSGQSEKAIEAITSGGFFGKGIGEGTLKNRVPDAHTDFIISAISEEFGVVVIILLLIIFLFFIYNVFKRLSLEKDEKIQLVMTGSITLILAQTLIHLAVNIRLFPTTGMTLPYLSYGGSSIIGVSILSGIILNLTKRKVN